jgi:LmbE family N-acetylglucosaminyl deacetylase
MEKRYLLKILAVGAHPDDVELGCGASLNLFRNKGHEVYILVLTRGEASGDPKIREKECRLSAKELCVNDIFFANLCDRKITDGYETISEIEKVLEVTKPDLVLAHGHKDWHQDHRNAGRATLSATRNINKVLLFESPAAMRDFIPQVFIDVTSTFDSKLKALESFGSQVSKIYFKGNGAHSKYDEARHFPHVSNAIEGLARYRGFQAGVPFAEAFEVGKFIWDIEKSQNQE